MRQHVIPCVVLLAEASVADVAAIWPNPTVDELVRLQISRGGKGLLAEGAFVRLILERKHRQVESPETFPFQLTSLEHP